jgi:hypothetical protein
MSDEQAEQEWLIEGFRRALKRLNETISKGDVAPMETFIPLFETLHWLVAAKVEPGLEGRDEWELARAVRFARNRVNHQWARALSLQDKPFPSVQTNVIGGSRFSHPPVVKMWCWLPLSGLPAEDPEHPDPKGERLYEDRLAEHLALEALDAIAVAL